MSVAHDDLYAQSWNTNFGPDPFEENSPDVTLNDDDVEYVPCQVPKINHPSSREISKTSGGSPVEHTTDLEEENKNEIPQETHSDGINSPQSTQKDKDTTPEEKTPKPQKTHKTLHCKKNPLQPVVKDTTCDLTLTQITLTLTDTKKKQTSKQTHLFCLGSF